MEPDARELSSPAPAQRARSLLMTHPKRSGETEAPAYTIMGIFASPFVRCAKVCPCCPTRGQARMNCITTARLHRRTGVNTMSGETSKNSKVARKAAAERVAAKPPLLAGGNPQIARADGDAPVQAYIAAMPGWKRDVGRRLGALIVRTVPGVRKAVRWNSPFYGIEDQGWFLSFHCFTKYVKVAFFLGASLRPLPPGESKHK